MRWGIVALIIPGLAAGIAARTATCPNDEKSCDSKTTAIFVADVAPASHGGAVVGVAGAF
jgi:hypothetical protein